MDNKIAGGIIGILGILLVFGGTVYLTQEQMDNAYVCSTTQQVYIFEKLSSTNKTGYWIENNTQKSAVCRNGIFTKVQFPNEIVPIQADMPLGTQYLCNQYNCTRII